MEPRPFLLYSAICSACGAKWYLKKTAEHELTLPWLGLGEKGAYCVEADLEKNSVSLYKTHVQKCESCSPGSSVQTALLAMANRARLCSQ